MSYEGSFLAFKGQQRRSAASEEQKCEIVLTTEGANEEKVK